MIRAALAAAVTLLTFLGKWFRDEHATLDDVCMLLFFILVLLAATLPPADNK
jgi:hypothetical protein